MRLAFLGSPGAAATVLSALTRAGHDIAVVVTRPDRRRSRGGPPAPTAVKELATHLGVPVAHEAAAAAEAGADLGVVVAYGRIIKPDVLAALPMVNVHFSLLPRWRGAAPVERAILAGDDRTGVCLMEVEEGLDTGGVYRLAETSIGGDETASELTARLALLGADLLVAALHDGLGRPTPQLGEPVYAAKVAPGDLQLDWTRSAAELHRVTRLERAWTTAGGRRLLVNVAVPTDAVPGPPGSLHATTVATGEGGLRLVTVQPEGRRPIPAEAWLRGSRIDALGS